jgi:hypothetical protein
MEILLALGMLAIVKVVTMPPPAPSANILLRER